MALLVTASLAKTIDAVNEARLAGRAIDPDEAREIVGFVVSRHNAGKCYRGMFAPTEQDLREGYAIFSGEHISKTADGAAGHVLGEEACRLLRDLGAGDPSVVDIAERAFAQVADSVRASNVGWYCCGRCSAAMWRHLAACRTDEAAEWLSTGIRRLADLRKGDGTWKRMPFYYTVLALTEAGNDAAYEELAYAAPRCERLRKSILDGPYAERRRMIVEKALALDSRPVRN